MTRTPKYIEDELLPLLAKARAQGVLVLSVSPDGTFEAHLAPPVPVEAKAKAKEPTPVYGPDGEQLHGEEAEIERGLFGEESSGG